MRARRTFALLVAAVAAPLVACSSSGDGAGPAPTTARANNACTLLDARALTASLGPGVGAGAPQGGSGWIVAQCTWRASDGTSASLAVGSEASLAARGVTGGVAAYVAKRREGDAAQFPVVDLPGAGDGGYAIAGRAPVALVYQDDAIVQVIVSSTTGPVDVGVAGTLAARAAANAAG